MHRRMSWLGLAALLGCLETAVRADDRPAAEERAHAEMAAALAAQADLNPPPVALPTLASLLRRPAGGASKPKAGARAAAADAAHSEAGQVSQRAQAQGAAQAAAHQAAAATAAAAGQSQSQAAKARAITHPHSR
jgi:hypothetical protein